MPTNQKAAQLQIRASTVEKAKLARAACARHMNLSQFVLSTSLHAAEEVLAEQTRIAMGAEGFDEFCRLLDEEPSVVPALREQFRKLNTAL
jgi:uncharacterized protein (DUF1778 family)